MSDDFSDKLKEYLFDNPGIKPSMMQAEFSIDQNLEVIQNLKNKNYLGFTIEGNVKFYERGKINFKEILEFQKRNIRPVKIDIKRFSYNFTYIDENNDRQLAYHSKRENSYKDLDSYPHHKHTGPEKNDYDEGNKLITLDEFIGEVEENEF